MGAEAVKVAANELPLNDPLVELGDIVDVLIGTGVILASCLHDTANSTKASMKKVATLALQFNCDIFIIVKLIRATSVNLHKILDFRRINFLYKTVFTQKINNYSSWICLYGSVFQLVTN